MIPQHRIAASPHRRIAASPHRRGKRSFTLIEILSAITIVAILSVALIFFTSSYIQWAQSVSDQRTLLVLNDALTRYKCEGGNVAGLTAGVPTAHVLSALQQPINWVGNVHQVMQSAVTYPARSLYALGSGANYRFSQYNTYINESGGTSPIDLGPGSSGLVLYYSMDNSTISGSTITDLSGSGHNGTLVNAPTSATGMVGQGLQFATSPAQSIAIGTIGGLTSDITVAMWIKPGSNPITTVRPISNYNGYGDPRAEFFLTQAEAARFVSVGGTLIGLGSPLNTSWHHVVGTRTSITGLVCLYVDGVLNNSSTGATGSVSYGNNGSWIINGNAGDIIDEVRIYCRALSQSEVTALYNWH